MKIKIDETVIRAAQEAVTQLAQSSETSMSFSAKGNKFMLTTEPSENFLPLGSIQSNGTTYHIGVCT